jgi:hypothetical protein
MKSSFCKFCFLVFLILLSMPSYSDDNSLNLYTYQTLKDTIIGIPVADIMVPKGFTVQINSQWDRLDGSYPGHEVIGLQNADNSVGIYIFTNESYYQFQNRNSIGFNMPPQQGPDYERRITLMNYMDSSAAIEVLLNNLGFNNRKLIQNLPIDNNKIQLIRNDFLKQAQIDLQKIHQMNQIARNGMQASLNGVDVNMSKKQYSVGATNLEACSCVRTVTNSIGNNMIVTLTTYWEIMYFVVYRANSKELFDKYYNTYQKVIGNSRIRPEFYFVNLKLKQMNEERVAKIGAIKSQISLEEQRKMIAQKNPSLTNPEAESVSDRVMNMWDDVITERDEYKTLDGRKLKTSMYNETVAQDGDTFYIGNKTGVPSGFKELSKSY